MRSKILLIFVVAVCMMAGSLVFTSCGDGGDGGDKVTIKIGLTAPLSGPGGGYGEDVKQGLDMAIADVNADGGLTIGDTTYIFELVPRDDEAAPERAIANAQQLVLEEGVNIIFDPYTSTIVPLLEFNTNPGEEFLIMSYTSIPIYESIPNRLMVTEPPPFAIYIPEFIELAMGRGWTRVAFLQTTERYGEIWGEAFSAAWTAAGGEVVAEAPASYYTETDFTPYLTTVLAANPDVLFVGGPSYPTALVMEQARGLGFTGGFICMDQAKLDDILEVIGAREVDLDDLSGGVDRVEIAYLYLPGAYADAAVEVGYLRGRLAARAEGEHRVQIHPAAHPRLQRPKGPPAGDVYGDG